MAQAQLAGGRRLVQGGHDVPVVLVHVDVELLEGGQVVKLPGMSTAQLLHVEVQLLVWHLGQVGEVRGGLRRDSTLIRIVGHIIFISNL